MLQLFLYEFITGGGLVAKEPPSGSLLNEGRAMLAALAADFAAIPGVQVATLHDHRLSPLNLAGVQSTRVATPHEHDRAFERRAAESDWTVVIAPEFDGILLELTRNVEQCGGRLLGPGADLVALGSDKQATADHFQRAGIGVPEGKTLPTGQPPPRDFPLPAVIKPLDGAGSQDVWRIEAYDARAYDRPMRLERFHEGLPASVAALCGPQGFITLPPCGQRLSSDGRFTYLGGDLPLPADLAARATKLAQRAFASLPSPLGYLGLDCVLGETGEDVVIELNPRLTTSYVGLRAAANQNLAAAILAIANGQDFELSFHPEQVQFEANGALVGTLRVP